MSFLFKKCLVINLIIWSSMIFFWPPLSQRRIKAFVSRPQIPLLISGSPPVSEWEPDLGGGGWCGGSVGFVATVRSAALLPAWLVICSGLGASAHHGVTGFKGGGLSLVPQWEGRVSSCPQRFFILTAGYWNIGHLMLFDLFSSLWSRILFSAKLVISCVSICMPKHILHQWREVFKMVKHESLTYPGSSCCWSRCPCWPCPGASPSSTPLSAVTPWPGIHLTHMSRVTAVTKDIILGISIMRALSGIWNGLLDNVF